MSKKTVYYHNTIAPLRGLVANGTMGNPGQVVTSNGSSVYWSTPEIGDITAVTAGSGMSGGGTTGAVTLNVLANSGIVANSSGTFVNSAYIQTITVNNANNASYLQTRTWESPGAIGSVLANSGAFTTLSTTANATFANVTITGNLIVTGTTTTVNTTNLDVFDAIIRLNRGQVSPANDIGILMQRYETADPTNYNVGFAWDETTDRLIFGTTPEGGSDNDLSFSTEWMTIAANGNVGIGNSSPVRKLTVQGDSVGTLTVAAFYNADLTNNNGSVFSFRTDTSGAGAQSFWEYAGVSGVVNEHNNATRAGSLNFFTANSTGGANRLTIISNGNVGIGTTTPSVKLDVVGNALFRGDASQTLDIGTTTGISYIQSYGASLAATPLVFYSGTSERMRVSTNNIILRPNVGTLGSTDDAFEVFPTTLTTSHEVRNFVRLLDTYNSGDNGQAFYIKSLTSGVHYGGWMLNSTWGSPIRLASASGGAESANSVISTYAQITQTSLSTVGLTFSTGNTTITGDLTVTGNTTLGDAATDTITINANSITIAANTNIDAGTLYIDSLNNRVGIGTSAPTQSLEVAGDILVTGESGIGVRTRFISGKSSPGNTAGPVYLQFNSSDFVQVGGGTGSANLIIANGSMVIANNGSGSGQIQLSAANSSANGGIGSEYWRARYYTPSDGAIVSGQRLYFQSAGAAWSRGTTYTTTTPFNQVSGTGEHFGIVTYDARSNATSSGLLSDLDVSHFANSATGASATLQYSVITSRTAELTWSGTAANSAMLYSGFTGGVLRYRVNRHGDIWTSGNVNVTSTLSTGNVTVTGDLSVTGNTTLGDAAADSVTINANSITITANSSVDLGTLYIDTLNNRVGVGNTTPTHKLSIAGDVYIAGAGSSSYYNTINNSGYTGVSPSGAAMAIRLIQTGIADWSIYNEATTGNLRVGSAAQFSANGNVGINTTAPTNKLDVVGGDGDGITYRTSTRSIGIGQVSGNSALYWGSGTDLTFFSGSERARITASGNLLVGTSTNRNRLTISGVESAAPTLGTATGAAIFMNSDPAYGMMFGVAGAGYGWIQQQRVDTTATAYNLILQPSGGNVGIATNSPAGKLDVLGIAYLGSDTNNSLFVNSNTTVTRVFAAGRSTFSNSALSFGSSNSTSTIESLRIDVAGNVGIGTTTPISKLQVSGPTGGLIVDYAAANYYDADTHYFRNFGATATTYLIPGATRTLLSTNAALPLAFGTNNDERMRISASGNVGIGTNNPGVKLDVVGVAHFYSGATGTFNHLNIGRTASETRIGVAAATNDFITGTAAGDSVFYSVASGNAWYGTAGAAATIFVTNNGERMRITSAGNIGIGTNSPATLFSMAAATATTFGLSLTPSGWNNARHRLTVPTSGDESVWSWNYTGSAIDSDLYGTSAIAVGNGTLKFLTNTTNTAPTERMRIDSIGNVGVGTTPSPWGGTYRAFEVRTGAVYDTAVGTGSGFTFNAYFNGTNWIYKGTGGNATALRYEQISGQHRWFTAPTGAGGGTITFTQTMTLDASGNVGIGIASPGARLDLGAYTGPALATSMLKMQDGWHDIITSSAVVGSRYYYGANIYGRSYANVNGFNIDTAATAVPIIFGTNNNERMRIDTSGNISVGMSSVNAKLNILQSLSGTYGSAGIWVTDNSTTSLLLNNISNGLSAVWASGALAFGAGTNNFSEQMRITSGGNVGIGIQNPAVRFVVSNAGTNGFEFNTADNIFQTYNRTTSAYTDMLLYALQHRFFSGSSPTESMRVAANGNVGIGNTAPTSKLFVTGDIALDGISVRDTATSTTTATTQITLFEYPIATYDSCDIIIKAVRSGERHTTKLLVTANTSVAIATEYGILTTGSTLYTVDVDVTGANTRVRITPTSTTSTVFKASYELITA